MIFRIGIKDERGESAVAIHRIVDYLGNRRLKPVVAAVSVQARIVGKALRMSSATNLIVRLIEISSREDEVAFPVALEAGAGHNIEDAIRAVAIIRVVAAAIDLERINVSRGNLRGPRLVAMFVLGMGTPSISQLT